MWKLCLCELFWKGQYKLEYIHIATYHHKKTFFITSKDTAKDQTKPARACNSCYEAVFPVLDPESPEDQQLAGGGLPHYSSIGTLTALPFSRSTPSLALPQVTTPILHPPALHYELPTPVKRPGQTEGDRPKSGLDFLPLTRPHMSGSRPSSEVRLSSYTVSTMASSSGAFELTNDSIATMSMLDSVSSPIGPVVADGSPRPRPKTTFSTPAVALHTTPVTARASMEADGKAIRYSLVLGGKSRMMGGNVENKENEVINGRKSLDSGLAVGKLTDLLRK
jgi:FYVE/RhoGEF/PH domain-containing protein 5/6